MAKTPAKEAKFLPGFGPTSEASSSLSFDGIYRLKNSSSSGEAAVTAKENN
jgi:hypothetical protein